MPGGLRCTVPELHVSRSGFPGPCALLSKCSWMCRRQEAYTCWSTASGARINNYGTRIDLILAAGPCGDAAGSFHAAVSDSDIWMDAHGSDHAPVYADLAPSLPILVGQVPPPLSSRYLYTGAPANPTDAPSSFCLTAIFGRLL